MGRNETRSEPDRVKTRSGGSHWSVPTLTATSDRGLLTSASGNRCLAWVVTSEGNHGDHTETEQTPEVKGREVRTQRPGGGGHGLEDRK